MSPGEALNSSMDKKLRLQDLTPVSEDVIVKCAKAAEDDDEGVNTFIRALDAGTRIRSHGLTPIYMCSADLDSLIVTSEENLSKRFH